MKFDSQNTVFLIDGSSFLYRAYYGLRPLHTSQGIPVQAVYSFCRMIQKLVKKFDVHYIALVWDSKGKTVRHEMYQEYKATRQEAPSDLFEQKKYITEFAQAIGLFQLERSGVEADDLMYSLARDFEKEGFKSVLVTSDKDMGQAITANTVLYDAFKDVVTDEQLFQTNMGFPVAKLPFYFALLGDASDNIPGVKGIGKKGAQDLVQQFASLEDLYQNLDQVTKNRTRTGLEENRDNAFLSRALFILQYYAMGVTTAQLTFDMQQWSQARALFERLEFKSLVQEIAGAARPDVPFVKLSELKNYIFHAVATQEQLDALCVAIKDKKLVAVDTELTGLDPLKDAMVGVSLCVETGQAYYVPFGHNTGEDQLSAAQVWAGLKPLLEDPSIKKIMHHAKFDTLAFMHHGVHVQGLIFDTLIAAHLVTEDWQRIGLKYISQFYLNEAMLSFADVVTNNGYKTFQEVPFALATEYAASDAHQTWQLYPILENELHKKNMTDLYNTIEFPLVSVLTAMEYEGIFCDTHILSDLSFAISRELATVKDKIAALVGPEYHDINLNSPKQLSELLFEHLQLPLQGKTAKKTGYSTDQEALEVLANLHPVPALIVQYRGLYKLLSTYVDALPGYINPTSGKIHTVFSQTAVATGRLASSDPNMQNIPVGGFAVQGKTVRSAFKPFEGHVFLSADYSQIELRVLAYLSQDPALVYAFNENQDIHNVTAATIFGIPVEWVTHGQRQIGKRINFSILYGLTPYGLSQDLKISFGDAKKYIEKYFGQYAGVATWMEQVIEETKAHGYVTTHWGRRRAVPGIYEKNKVLYDAARRIAINTKAQGTAAELMKIGMINVQRILQQKGIDAHLVLQIHDELLISVAQDQAAELEQIVKETLEGVVQWNVPLVVTTRLGNDWNDVTK